MLSLDAESVREHGFKAGLLAIGVQAALTPIENVTKVFYPQFVEDIEDERCSCPDKKNKRGFLPSKMSAVEGIWEFNITNSLRMVGRHATGLVLFDFLHSPFILFDQSEWVLMGLNFSLGAVAGVVGNTIAHPLDYSLEIRQRLCLYCNRLYHPLQDIYKTCGFTHGVFAGWGLTSSAAALYAGMQFSLFHCFQEYNPWRDMSGIIGLTLTMFAACMSHWVTLWFHHPLLCLQDFYLPHARVPVAQRRFRSWRHCFAAHCKTFGLRSLYYGVSVRFAQVGIGTVMLGFYDRWTRMPRPIVLPVFPKDEEEEEEEDDDDDEDEDED